MRVLTTIIAAVCLIAIAGAGAPAQAASATRAGLQIDRDIGHQTLAPDDGWGAFSTGTTGGSAAAPEQVYTATNRQELIAALAGATPKIVYVAGTIDANVDDANQPFDCDNYAAPGYSLEAYLAAYDPATWGRTTRPSGPLEDARVASQRNQAARIRVPVGSNTTIIGVGNDARIVGANLIVDRVDNIIIRNITFQDAFDCFPVWDPTDGSTGNWNSQYDSISLTTATHVWVDHCAFNDGDNPDSNQPIYFDRPYQVHDGALDITRGSDFVTVSWNHFHDHDKTMLIGSTDNPGTPGSPTSDRGKLRVTVHHNLFANTFQRLPRVRFGQVHVYNNYYDIPDADGFIYAWGVGVESQIYAQNNYFRSDGVTPDRFIRRFNGTMIHAEGTLVNGRSLADIVDVVAAYNAVNNPDLASTVSWTPTLFTRIHPTQAVPNLVTHLAGPYQGQGQGPSA